MKVNKSSPLSLLQRSHVPVSANAPRVMRECCWIGWDRLGQTYRFKQLTHCRVNLIFVALWITEVMVSGFWSGVLCVFCLVVVQAVWGECQSLVTFQLLQSGRAEVKQLTCGFIGCKDAVSSSPSLLFSLNWCVVSYSQCLYKLLERQRSLL